MSAVVEKVMEHLGRNHLGKTDKYYSGAKLQCDFSGSYILNHGIRYESIHTS